jgi:hypothetical protein
MKVSTFIFIGLVFLLWANPLNSAEPVIKTGIYILDGSKPLAVDRHSTPTAVDWNNDGAKDLVVGQFGYGRIWLYLNQGTDLNPVFKGGSMIQSNGAPIQVPSG